MMENSGTHLNNEIQKAFEVIQQGGIILYPTDTVWGIGCDATNPEVVAKIYNLKPVCLKTSKLSKYNGKCFGD